jgi:mono/diheme cytochrome c family protein
LHQLSGFCSQGYLLKNKTIRILIQKTDIMAMARNCILLLAGALLFSCSYKNEEELYPVVEGCDTLSVSYNQRILPILQDNCLGCHSGASPSGDVNLDSYASVWPYIQNGSLLNAIRYNNLASPMPPSGKMNTCNIDLIAAWINQGASDN